MVCRTCRRLLPNALESRRRPLPKMVLQKATRSKCRSMVKRLVGRNSTSPWTMERMAPSSRWRRRSHSRSRTKSRMRNCTRSRTRSRTRSSTRSPMRPRSLASCLVRGRSCRMRPPLDLPLRLETACATNGSRAGSAGKVTIVGSRMTFVSPLLPLALFPPVPLFLLGKLLPLDLFPLVFSPLLPLLWGTTGKRSRAKGREEGREEA
mmetsp:Transcript_45502/g.97282  ORF Transcript_45502/g.97282 Transcript_45502/m.97282 type:complete len:207 (+) Transcript_45502:332-952(+)